MKKHEAVIKHLFFCLHHEISYPNTLLWDSLDLETGTNKREQGNEIFDE